MVGYDVSLYSCDNLNYSRLTHPTLIRYDRFLYSCDNLNYSRLTHPTLINGKINNVPVKQN